MHLACLGVMLKLLFAWLKGRLRVRLCSSQVKTINERLSRFSQYIPADFARKCRSLADLKHFKATEFRLLLLYLGPFVFKGVISDDCYSLFLLLHTAFLF